MRTGTRRRREGQYTLVIGVFILILVVVLTVSLYMLYSYFKNTTLKRIERIQDLARYSITPINITVQDGETIIETRGSISKILTGVAYCINASRQREIISTRKLKILNNKLVIDCVSNSTLNMTIEYHNLRRQRIHMYLGARYYTPLVQVEGTNMTINANLTITVYAVYEYLGIPFYAVMAIETLWNLRNLYNTDYIYVKDVPVYYYANPKYEIMYLNEKMINFYKGSTNSYYFINETIRNIIKGSGKCKNIGNYTIVGVYPYTFRTGEDYLSNCSVEKVLSIYTNITRTYLNKKYIRKLNITLARLLSVNQIINHFEESLSGTSLVYCTQIGTNQYECSIIPSALLIPFLEEKDEVIMEFLLNTTGLENSLISLIKGFCNSSIIVYAYYSGFEQRSYINLVVSLLLVNALGEYEELKFANITVTCNFNVVPPCQTTVSFYNSTIDVAPLLSSVTVAYLLLRYKYYNVDESIIALDFHNITLIPLR
ncbi:MAG: hypothetical protein GXO10_06095 [Crenarchaeota archaeon]|nr:hypothetical protein [Thermoproteota archaeon]